MLFRYLIKKNYFLVAPKIVRMFPEGGEKTVDKGTPLTLMCEASGFPIPTIEWTKKVIKSIYCELRV